MNKPAYPALDLSLATTTPLEHRPSKVTHTMLADPANYSADGISIDTLIPPVLKGADLTAVADAWASAIQRDRAVILGMGAHPIKVGLSRLIVDLIERGYINGLAGTGAVALHDWEMAIHGHTSEEVKDGLPEGLFGMASDTAVAYWKAVELAQRENYGLGQAVGCLLSTTPDNVGPSILATCYNCAVPTTLHVTIGADTAHMHPGSDGGSLGLAAMRDFLVLGQLVTHLDDGGLYINLGSAVTLPEVFLKAINIARNITGTPHKIVTANFDMLQHYRPSQNVVDRPTQPDGRGYRITGHHEVMFPLLYAMVRKRLN